jgi:hypothetical protein
MPPAQCACTPRNSPAITNRPLNMVSGSRSGLSVAAASASGASGVAAPDASRRLRRRRA